MEAFKSLPPQQIPMSQKGPKWRKKHLDWADDRSYYNNGKVRSAVLNKRINYDLVNGKLHTDDLMLILNPNSLESAYIPDTIQHYPVINSKLNVLRGEEVNRRFDFKVICTNPSAISSIEEKKKNEFFENYQRIIQSSGLDENALREKLEKLQKEFKYNWQDIREIRANALLNHYIKEYNIQGLFSDGFVDAMVVGEEIYRCYIVSGEPVIEKINPLKLRAYRSGYSSKVEDADIIVYEDYWSLGKIIDTFYDQLKPSDIKYLENLPYKGDADAMDNRDTTRGFINADDILANNSGVLIDSYLLFTGPGQNEVYDSDGNIRVLQVFWKSRRKIKKVKSFDPVSGEEVENFYTEDYILDEAAGETEEIFWVNEAWEGFKIGKEVYVGMKPCEVQYNRLSNPSRCHFGFIGSFYNINEDRVFSLVDALKPFAYAYDVVSTRLREAMDANFGQLFELDLASVPKGWELDKWFYYAKQYHLAVKDSFKEGTYGAGVGKMAGAFAASSRGIIGNNTGDYIQQHINYLEFIKNEMSEAVGITKQREGQIANRETVGGIERATLQSSYITEYLFNTHMDVKRRVLECFLETAKVAMRGKNKKFQYILSDGSASIIDIDGDLFAENDYGLAVDSTPYTQNLSQKLDGLAQAALQNQLISFSTMMKTYTNSSLVETIRMIEEEEEQRMQQAQQQQQQQMQLEQQQLQAEAQKHQMDLEAEEARNIRDNETKIMIARMQIDAKLAELGSQYDGEPTETSEELKEKIRQFDEKLKLDREKLELDKKKAKDDKETKERDLQIKEKAVNARKTTSSKQ